MMITNSITKIYIYHLDDLTQIINNLDNISDEQLHLKFIVKNISREWNNITNHLSKIKIKNLYISINYKNDSDLTKKLIEIVPEKITRLKLKTVNYNNEPINLKKLINLKQIFLKNIYFNESIISFLCELLTNNLNLQSLFIFSTSCPENLYYEVFLSKILNALKKNNINIQSIKFNIPNFMENITNKSYYIYYKEIMELVENNKYTPNKLLSLYTDLTKNITDLNNTKKIYPSIQEESIKNIISTAINSSEIMIEKKTITYNNALKYAICNVNNKVIAEAIYILSQELQLSNPLEAYKILINIPIYFEQIYKKANYSMAHILLSLEDNEFETLNLSCPDLQANKLNKMQMIIAHLSESGSTDKDLFNKILNEYVFNQGIVESKDNPFESILINQELFPPKTSDLLFVLDAWKKYVENPNKFNLDEQHDQSETSITQPKLLYR